MAAEQEGGGINRTRRGPKWPGPGSGVCAGKRAATAPGHPSLAPGSPPANRPGFAARQELRGGARAEGERRPGRPAAWLAAAKATAEAAGRARAHCRGARFGGRGSVQSSLFDGISVYRVYTLISTCFLLLLLFLL